MVFFLVSEKSEIHTIFDVVLLRGYLTLVYLTAVVLSLFITGTPKIKLDLSMIRFALGITTVTLLLAYTVSYIIDDITDELEWWFYTIDATFGRAASVFVLFLFQVSKLLHGVHLFLYLLHIIGVHLYMLYAIIIIKMINLPDFQNKAWHSIYDMPKTKF